MRLMKIQFTVVGHYNSYFFEKIVFISIFAIDNIVNKIISKK